MANASTLVLRALALACVVAAASAAADRQLLGGGSNKNCTGSPSGVTGTTLACTLGATSARGTTCAFTCVAPSFGAGGTYTCQDKKWKVTAGSACVIPTIKVEVEGSKKFGKTLKLEVKVSPKISTTAAAAIAKINGTGVALTSVGSTVTNNDGKGAIYVPLTAPNFAAGSTYTLGIAANFGGGGVDPQASVTFTVRS